VFRVCDWQQRQKVSTMQILALNCGSSSLKSALFDVATNRSVLEVRVEHLDSENCRIQVGRSRRAISGTTAIEAADLVLQEMAEATHSLGPDAIVHRIVHGGATFSAPVLLSDDKLRIIERLSDMAPLHNPVALAVIELSRQRFADLPHIAVFDTAFHSTLPPRAREYALPRALTSSLGIRRFGFHGISHGHVMHAVAERMQMQPHQLRIISCHLGNGASVAAIEYGRSVDTSMGMTPLEGLVMGSRCGDIDPGVLLHLQRAGRLEVDALEQLLSEGSGLQGLTNTNDLEQIEARAANGDPDCRLAIALYAHRIRKYVGAYAAVMGGVDVIAFTGGVGEHSALMRHRILQRLGFLGALLDEDRNRVAALDESQPLAELSADSSHVKIFAVRANEEQAMAHAAAKMLQAGDYEIDAISIPIAVSVRHAHLSQATLQRLFGDSFELEPQAMLSQTGQYAAVETVALIGSRGRIDNVRLIGPPREVDQVEISRSDEFVLGIDAPVRVSGDLENTPGITIEGPLGRVSIKSGVICAHRHIHMSPADAERLQLRDHDALAVQIDSDQRDLIFQDVTVRVAPEYKLELHLDTDEANAAGVRNGDTALLLR
jgi:acetate kinase